MRINLAIPAHLTAFVNSQRGTKSVQSYLIELIAEKKELSPNYEELNESEESRI